MINSELSHVTSVEQFNMEIVRQQTEAHGLYYCDIHEAIRKYSPTCNSYMELGVHQGGTASTALLCGFPSITLVDIDLSRYRKFLQPLARQFCESRKIKLTEIESDSTSLRAAALVDMLVIDSLHTAQHMQRELDFHGKNTSKYIIAHDTSVINGRADSSLFDCLMSYGERNGWSLKERGVINVGYTVMERTSWK